MKIRLLSLFFPFFILFATITYASESTFFTVATDFSAFAENKNYDTLVKAIFLSDDLSATTEPKVLYTQNNIPMYLRFKYTGSDYPNNISVKINDTKYNVTDTPDNNGYVCFHIPECEDKITSPASVVFCIENSQTQTFTLEPTEIVAQEENWTTSADGHTLYTYTGNDSFPTVPNFYKGNVITTVGGYDGDNISNILENKTTGIAGINISDGIQKIGNYAFYKISSLTTVSMPDSIELIGGVAFKDTSLTGELILPKSTKEIYGYAFNNTNITSLVLNTQLERICSYAFAENSNLAGTLSLPNTLYYLGEGAFYQCVNLSGDLTIPSGITKVGDGAFFECTGFNGKLTLENGVEEIGTLAFGSAKKAMCFNNLILPDSLKKIGPYSFQFCSKIPTLVLPEGLEVISDGAFNHMSGLENTSVTIPSTVTTIGGDYLVDENTGYGGHIFYDMGKNATFKAIYVANGNKYFTSLDGVLYSADRTRLLAYPKGKQDVTYEIPEGVTQIDEMAFSRVPYLKKLILPDSYTISTDLPENILNRDSANTLSGALYLYTAVNNVSVKSSNTKYKSVDGILYSADMKTLWYIPNMYNGTVNIADGVEKTEKGSMFIANKNNTKWTDIVFPSSVIWLHNDTVDVCNNYFKNLITINENLYYNVTDGSIIENEYTLGDLNGDGKADNKDAAIVLKHINSNTSSDFNKKAADINKDKKVDILDVIMILKGVVK